MKKTLALALAAALMITAAAGCTDSNQEIASIVQTDSYDTVPQETEENQITVSTVDEFLSALNSNVTIVLTDRTFYLDQASDYGKDSDNPAYYWEPAGEGDYQLVLNHLHDLTIRGADLQKTALLTTPWYANVLSLKGCKRIRLEKLTAGHADDAYPCTGGVIDLNGCRDITMDSVALFGCGIWGVTVRDSQGLDILKSRIFDCSISGLDAENSRDIHLADTDFYTLGTPEEPGTSVFDLRSCENVTMENCSVTENNVMQLLFLSSCRDISLKNMEFRANHIMAYAFQFLASQPVVEHCSFEGNDLRKWYQSESMMAEDENGQLIGNELLPPIPLPDPDETPLQKQIRVTTADEFLAAIGSDREIILDAPVLDLSSASNYGTGSSPHYYWQEEYDGPGLVICDAENLTIRAEGTDRKTHTISAVPRYANVLSFRGCSHILVSGFTAGHTEAPGECSGGVLSFEDCDQITVDGCGLFGCGILGVDGSFCSRITVSNCDIYDCSFGGIQLYEVQDAVLKGNSFRGLGGPEILEDRCDNLSSDCETNRYPEPLN